MTDKEVMTSPNFPLVAPDKESIKLEKNSRGYNWEIKVLSDRATEEDIKRLEQLNKLMQDLWEFGAE